ncbi:MAG: hypothetical protein WDA37_04315, partial [Dysgonamonadaceae bacterium]
MSGIKFISHFYDINENKFVIEIYRPGKSDPVYEINHFDGDSPVTLSHGGSDKNSMETTVIQGMQVELNFYMPREDVDKIDYIFESQYQDYVVDYKDGANNLIFRGYVKPENLTKRYEKNPPYIEISMPANDGLNDLQGFDFRDENDDLIVGRYTLIEVLYMALAPISKNVMNFDFLVQLNTYETTYMSATQCVLSQLKIDTRAFIEGELTENRVKSCYDVIYRILQPFNAILKQVNGKYVISNPHELESYIHEYTWGSTNVKSRTASNTVLDITDYLYEPYIEQQKIHPLRSASIIQKNTEVSKEIDISDWTKWIINDFDGSVIDPGGDPNNPNKSIIHVLRNAQSSNSSAPPYLLIENIPLTQVSTTDYILFQMEYELLRVERRDSLYKYAGVFFKFEIQRPNGEWSVPLYSEINKKKIGETVTLYVTQEDNLQVTETGNYNIRITIIAKDGHYRNLILALKTPQLFINPTTKYADNISSSDTGRRTTTGGRPASTSTRNEVTGTVAGSSTDRRRTTSEPRPSVIPDEQKWTLTQTKGYEKFEADLFFSDAIRAKPWEEGESEYNHTMLVNFFYGYDDGTTKSWNTYNKSEGKSIIYVYSKNIVNNRKAYKNYLRTNIIDRNHVIQFNHILKIEDKYYFISQYNRDYRNGIVSVGLIEILTGDADYEDFEREPLKSAVAIATDEDPLVFDGIEQEAHTLEVGMVVRYDPELPVMKNGEADLGGYVPALADTPENAKAIGIVSEVLNDDKFKFISDDYIRSDSELYKHLDDFYEFEIGEYYFLSPEDEGGLLKSAQLELGDIEQCVGYVTTKGFKVEIDARMIELPSAKTDMSVRGEGRAIDPITLVNDESTPAALKYYGTDDNGNRGYHSLLDFMPEDGAQGAQGFQGDQGFQGFQGNTGTQGAQGAQGAQGYQGEKGSQGVRGYQGYQGEKGDTGNQGFQG